MKSIMQEAAVALRQALMVKLSPDPEHPMSGQWQNCILFKDNFFLSIDEYIFSPLLCFYDKKGA